MPWMLVPILFSVSMIGLIKLWMFSSPVKRRNVPEYSLEVMNDLPDYRSSTILRSKVEHNYYLADLARSDFNSSSPVDSTVKK